MRTNRMTAGYTIAEMLVTITLLSLLTGMIAMGMQEIQHQQRNRSNMLELQDNLRIAMNTLVENISCCERILYGDSGSIVVEYRNKDKGKMQVVRYRIGIDYHQLEHDYDLHGGVLHRVNIYDYSEGSPEPIANFIQRMEYTYLDAAGREIADMSQVRFVRILLTGQYQNVTVQECQIVSVPGAIYI